MIKRTNLDINNAACLHIVHILQHPTSRPTTKSTRTSIVNAPKNTVNTRPAAEYGKSTKWSTQWRHQANQGKSSLEAERVRALGALCGLRSKKKLVAEKLWERHFSSNEEKEKWIEGDVERKTAGARKQVEDAEAVVQQEQEEMRKAENAGWTNREHDMTFHEMMVAIGDSLSDFASSDDEEDGEDENDEETQQGKLSQDDEPSWVMGTISTMVQQRMERFWQKQMKLDGLTQPGWEDAADYLREGGKKYGTSDLRVAVVVKPQLDDDAAAPALTTFQVPMECLENVSRILWMPQATSWKVNSHVPLGSGKPQSNTSISGLAPAAELNSSLILNAQPVELISFHHCI